METRRTSKYYLNNLHICDTLFKIILMFFYIDGTCCLNRYNYPLYVFLVVGGDNTGHVVGYALVKDETTCTLSSLFSEFMRKSG